MTDLEQKIKNLSDSEKESLLALLNKVTADEEPKIWEPKESETFFFVDARGDSSTIHYFISKTMGEFLTSGNYYKTEELAERAAERRKRTGIFENKMLEFSQGYEFKGGKDNCYLYYHDVGCDWRYGYTSFLREPLVIYMTEQQAEKAVQWANKHYPNGL